MPAPPPRLRRIGTIGFGRASALALAPDGRLLAVGTEAGWGLYSLPDLQQVRFEAVTARIFSLFWASNSRYLAVASTQRTSVYRFPEAVLASSIPGESLPVAFSSDGRLLLSVRVPAGSLASIGPPRPSYATLLDSDTGNLLASLETFGSVILSPDTTLLTTERDNHTLLWKTDNPPTDATSTPLARMPGMHPIFSPNGRILATTPESGGGTEFWRVPSGERITYLPTGVPASSWPPMTAFSDDSSLFYVVTRQQLQTWDIAQGTLIRSFPVPETFVQFSSGGRVLMTYSGGSDEKPGIRFTRLSDGQVIYSNERASFEGGGVDVSAVTFSADGSTAAYLMLDGHIRVLDLAGGSVRTLMVSAYTRPAFSPDGRILAAVQGQAEAAAWRTDDLASVRQFILPEPMPLHSWHILTRVEFTPDGQALMTQHYDGTMEGMRLVAARWELASNALGQAVWDLRQTNDDRPVHVKQTYLSSPVAHAAAWANKDGIHLQPDGGTPIKLALGDANQVIDMAFSADGRLLAASDNGGFLRVFRIAPTIGLIQTLQVGNGYGVEGVVFSSDGTLMGLPLDGGRIWRVGESLPLVQFATDRGVIQLVISPNNQTAIAIRGRDHHVAFYRMSDGQEVGEIPIDAGEIALSPAGDRLAVIVQGQIQIWEVGL